MLFIMYVCTALLPFDMIKDTNNVRRALNIYAVTDIVTCIYN